MKFEGLDYLKIFAAVLIITIIARHIIINAKAQA